MNIILNRLFYNLDAVKEALSDFSSLVDGEIMNSEDNFIELELKEKEKINNLREEFCNYILALMKNKAMV